MIVFTLVPQSSFPKAEVSYTFLSIYSESQSHLTMYLARAYTRATLLDLHHCRPLPGRVRFKGSPQNPLPRGVLDEDKEGVGRVARITVGQVNALSGLSSRAGVSRRFGNWKGHPNRRWNAAFVAWVRTWNINMSDARGAVLGVPRSAAIRSKSLLVLVNAPISPTRPARIWNNLEILIADASIGGFVIDNHP